MGINSRADLAVVTGLMQARIQAQHMQAGVTIEQPSTTWIESGVAIGSDTVIRPFSLIERGAVIGSDCVVGPYACIGAGQEVRSGTSAKASAGYAGVSAT
jgi:bifunctional UDP-N-acetylglucosamine pyrophosphorylase/glucosamine-1-phosphate N-acetyltransferase